MTWLVEEGAVLPEVGSLWEHRFTGMTHVVELVDSWPLIYSTTTTDSEEMRHVQSWSIWQLRMVPVTPASPETKL